MQNIAIGDISKGQQSVDMKDERDESVDQVSPALISSSFHLPQSCNYETQRTPKIHMFDQDRRVAVPPNALTGKKSPGKLEALHLNLRA